MLSIIYFSRSPVSWRRSDAPVAVERPRTLLAFLAAVLGASASAAFGELASVFFPLAALVVGTLADAASRVVLPAQVPHDDASPVLHVGAVMSDGELFDQGKDVEIVWKKELFLHLFLVWLIED